MILTIDGPAGTGKSSVAQAVAQELGFNFLDTGAMYRAVALAALRDHADLNNNDLLGELAKSLRIDFDFKRVPPLLLLNDEPVTRQLRDEKTTQAASVIAQSPAVRQVLVAHQQEIGRTHKNLVSEGRDQGSVVFPQAMYKFYLDATPAERARRRAAQLEARGESVDLQELLNHILERDQRDSTRSSGPLKIPTGAIVIDTTELTQPQVIERIVAAVRHRQGV